MLSGIELKASRKIHQITEEGGREGEGEMLSGIELKASRKIHQVNGGGVGGKGRDGGG